MSDIHSIIYDILNFFLLAIFPPKKFSHTLKLYARLNFNTPRSLYLCGSNIRAKLEFYIKPSDARKLTCPYNHIPLMCTRLRTNVREHLSTPNFFLTFYAAYTIIAYVERGITLHEKMKELCVEGLVDVNKLFLLFCLLTSADIYAIIIHDPPFLSFLSGGGYYYV